MHSKFKLLVLLTALMGMLAVTMGAFGSHYLVEKISERSLSAYKTAVQYQFYHTLAMFCTALLYRIYRIKGLFYIALYFMGGMFLFSGSIYILSLKDLLGIQNLKFIGILTPIGGLALIGSWAAIFFTVVRIKPPSKDN